MCCYICTVAETIFSEHLLRVTNCWKSHVTQTLRAGDGPCPGPHGLKRTEVYRGPVPLQVTHRPPAGTQDLDIGLSGSAHASWAEQGGGCSAARLPHRVTGEGPLSPWSREPMPAPVGEPGGLVPANS